MSVLRALGCEQHWQLSIFSFCLLSFSSQCCFTWQVIPCFRYFSTGVATRSCEFLSVDLPSDKLSTSNWTIESAPVQTFTIFSWNDFATTASFYCRWVNKKCSSRRARCASCHPWRHYFWSAEPRIKIMSVAKNDVLLKWFIQQRPFFICSNVTCCSIW